MLRIFILFMIVVAMKRSEVESVKKYCNVVNLFEQELDHFNPKNTQTFSQRYIVSNYYWKVNKPIFFVISGNLELSCNQWSRLCVGGSLESLRR